jgi:hypothetical protein
VELDRAKTPGVTAEVSVDPARTDLTQHVTEHGPKPTQLIGGTVFPRITHQPRWWI